MELVTRKGMEKKSVFYTNVKFKMDDFKYNILAQWYAIFLNTVLLLLLPCTLILNSLKIFCSFLMIFVHFVIPFSAINIFWRTQHTCKKELQ